MSLVQRIADLATRVAAEIKKKVESTDSRLSNSREWVAETISQPEAEGGTATTRRAWSSQRVRQAAAAWWLTASSAIGRTLATAADAAAARAALVLGTAALAATGQADPNVPTNLDVRAYYGVRYKPAIKPTLLIDWLESRFVIYSASANSFFVTEDWDAFVAHLGADLTIVRAGEQAYFNAIGSMQFAAANTIQCDHDPLTGSRLGPYIGPSTTAVLLYSTALNNAAWGKTRASVTPNAYTALNGTMTAVKLVESTETGPHYIRQGNTLTSGIVYLAVFVVVAGERTKVVITFPSINAAWITTRSATFDLVSGALIATSGEIAEAGIIDIGKGRHLCYVSSAAAATGFGEAFLTLVNNAGQSSYTGDGTSGAYVLYGNITDEPTPSPLIVTSGSTVNRPATTIAIGGAKFTGCYNPAEGVLEVSAELASGRTGTRRLLSINDGTANNRIGIYADTLTVTAEAMTTGVQQSSLSAAGAVSASTSFRIAHSYKANDFILARDGGNSASDTSGTIPTVDRLQIAHLNGAGQPAAYIERIAYYPRSDSAANLLERSKL